MAVKLLHAQILLCVCVCMCMCMCVCVRVRVRVRVFACVFKPGRPPIRRGGYVQIATNINDNNEKLSVTFFTIRRTVVLYSKDAK